MALESTEIIADIWFNGKPYAVNESFAPRSLVNPFSAQIGSGGGAYSDFDQWAYFLQDNWQAGVGQKDPDSDGFRFSTLETRYSSEFMLPLRREKYQDKAGGDCCYFIEECGCTYMACGDTLSKWNEEICQFETVAVYADLVATGIALFDGYIFIGNGLDAAPVWFDTESGAAGDVLPQYPGSTGQLCGDHFEVSGGFLFAVCCDRIYYTSGARLSCDDPNVPPTGGQVVDLSDDDPPQELEGDWNWYCLKIGPCNTCDCITGIANIVGSSLGDQRLYIATAGGLWQVLPGDVPLYVRDWPIADPKNGQGMTEHFGQVYAPVGEGLYRITDEGIFTQIGINENEPLPCHKRGCHVAIEGIGTQIYSMIQPADPSGSASVWVFSNGGWHFVACLPAGEAACGLHYSSTSKRLFMCTSEGVYGVRIPAGGNNPLSLSEARYADSGYIDTGAFTGELYEIDKYLHSVFVAGRCISDGQRVRIYWRDDEPYAPCDGCTDTDTLEGWQLLGVITQDDQELFWPCPDGPVTKRIYFRIELVTDDPSRTPVVDAFRIKYLPNVRDRFSMSYSIPVPRCDLRDGCDNLIPDYEQDDWRCCIEEAVRSSRPVELIDIDERVYSVWVTNATEARAAYRYNRSTGSREVDYTWSITVMEVCPDPPERCSVDGQESTQSISHAKAAVDSIRANSAGAADAGYN